MDTLIGKTLKTYAGKTGIIKSIDPPYRNLKLNWVRIEGDNGYSAQLGIDDNDLNQLQDTGKTTLYQII